MEVILPPKNELGPGRDPEPGAGSEGEIKEIVEPRELGIADARATDTLKAQLSSVAPPDGHESTSKNTDATAEPHATSGYFDPVSQITQDESGRYEARNLEVSIFDTEPTDRAA